MPKLYTQIPFSAISDNIRLVSEIMLAAEHFAPESDETGMLFSMASDLVKGLHQEVPEEAKPEPLMPISQEALMDAIASTPANYITQIASFLDRSIEETRAALRIALKAGTVVGTGAKRSRQYFAA